MKSAKNDRIEKLQEVEEWREQRIQELEQEIARINAQLSRCSDYDSILAQFINAQDAANFLQGESDLLTSQVKSANEEVDRLKAINDALDTKLQNINNEIKNKTDIIAAERAARNETNDIIAARDAEIVSLKAQSSKLLATLKAFIEINDSQ